MPLRPTASGIEAQQPHPAVCRVVNQFGRQQNLGTGTLVEKTADRAWVVTCAHLFREGTSGIHTVFPSGETHVAQLVAVDTVNDLAVLAIAPPRANPVSVNTEATAGTLTACGFGQTGSFACATGPVIGYATPVGATEASTKIGVPVRLGDSGGAVFAPTGEFCGVIWGVRDGVTYATCGRPLRRFLDRLGIPGRTEIGPSLDSQRTGRLSDQSKTPQAEISQRYNELTTRVESLERKPAPAPNEPDLSDYARVDDLNAVRAQSDERQADIMAEMKKVVSAARTAAVVAARDVIAEHLTALPQGFATWLPAALGLTGPAGLAVGALAWVGMRRIKKRLGERRQGDGETRRQGDSDFKFPPLRPIAVDTPPLPQQMVPETHYVTVQGNEYAQAHLWATEQVVRKYPGATEVLSTLDALIKQQMNAK